ncbi:involucrin repeat protein [Aspergillus sclerotioniger CBS 115572]|uniref:Involucrin repeat protein n=1 Tax=Aspergillus sclerotioniger CBS 115572 TaxID=1450535 RepID=A0A317WLU2_9EURO|nr:involucrin repeat protein [Aspergillus sclerotioniger CBS 115572]PWY87363.1 involucrin repeat protein [Aspergillus sclerotioniger CBS 115572]
MNSLDIRSSQSSYGEPTPFAAAASYGAPQPPPTKVLMEGYRDALDPQPAEKPRYAPINTAHLQSSEPLNTHDPVAMYLLTETAMTDSTHYEILSLEEVETLKKEHKFLSSRLNAAKGNLALEMKLRDAAMSLSRLYTSKSPSANGEYDLDSSPNSRQSRRSLLGPNDPAMDKTEEELALSTRKCEELAQEIWTLERRVQQVNNRLLEHTAGILQMTHKGLKKNLQNNVPDTPESLSSHNTRASVDDFDDRSFYKPTEHLDGSHGHGPREGPVLNGLGLEAIQDTERRLEYLSGKVRDMILQSNPNHELAPIPQPSHEEGPVSPTATVEAHLAYIENGMEMLSSNPSGSLPQSRAVDSESEQQLKEINARLYSVIQQSGIPHVQTLPPPPDPSHGDMAKQFGYLSAGINGLEERIDKLLEQKSILTTQIQQQRELNSKSDAERDAHIADLGEQLAHVRKDLELSESEGQQSRDALEHAMEQLEAMRQELASHQEEHKMEDTSGALTSEKEARARAEAELEHLQVVMKELQHEKDAQAEAHEARARAENELAQLEAHVEELRSQHATRTEELTVAHSQAEGEITRLQGVIVQVQGETDAKVEAATEAHLQQLRSQSDAHTEELTATRSQADSEIARLQDLINQLQNEVGSKAEASEAHERAEQQILQLEETMQQIRNESDAQIREATESRVQAESEVVRLETLLGQLRADMEPQLKEATEARTQAEGEVSRLEATLNQLRADVEVLETQHKQVTEARTSAEENATRLQAELTEMEGEVVRAQTELTMAKAELDGAYGSRAQRAADIAANPAIQREFDELNTRNLELAEELAALKAGKPGSSDLQHRVEALERELRETVDDYEAMTKASIEFERERERFESVIDALRDRCEQLETQLNEERINWMGSGRDGHYETTSTMVLKNEFKKMMRDTRVENMKILKAEQEERRRLESLIRNLKKEQANLTGKSSPSQGIPVQ